jgi:hypothetical protein
VYAKLKNASDDGPSSGRPSTEDPRWRAIRNLSVLGFVNKVAKTMGGENDRALARALADSALSGGAPVPFQGIIYTPEMQIDMYQRRDEPRDELLKTKRDWDEFQGAMRKVRDPNEPMASRNSLLRIGEAMEARQRPHAVAKGWA